jgi:O-antigen ligase
MIWLLSLICFALPTYLIRFKIFGIPTTLLEVLIYIAAASQVFIILKSYFIFHKSYFISLKSYLISPIALLFIAIITSIIISPDKRVALGIAKGWFFDPILLGVLVALNVITEKDFAKIVYGLAAGGAVVSLWGILQWFGFSYLLPHQRIDPSFVSYLATGRAFGPFESPNYLGMYLAPISAIALGQLLILYLKSKILNHKSHYFLTFCLTTMLLALLFTKSLGAWLGFVVALIFLCYYFLKSYFINPKSKFILHISYLIFLISIIAACLLLINKLGLGRIAASFAARTEVWQVSWYLIKQHPILGIGLGVFPKMYNQIIPQIHFPPINWLQMHPHNIFLAFWLNLGLLGLASFIWILCLFFKSCFILLNHKSKIINPILTAAMLAILAHGLIDTTYWKNDLSAIFWVIVGLAMSIQDLRSKM